MRAARLLLPVVLALSACGTTVPGAGQAGVDALAGGSAGSAELGGVAAPVAPGAAVDPVAGGGPTAAGGSVAGGSVAGRADGAAAPAADSPAAAPVRRSGQGYTDRQIKLGFSISSDAARALGATGLGVSIADQQELVRSYLDKVNRAGGIAGRTAVPVFYDYSAGGDLNSQDQAACAKWTQDEPVFAATGVRAGSTGSGDTLTPCLAKAGVPWLQGVGDQHKWARFLPAMYNVAAVNATREARLLVESLAAQDFLPRTAKVGVVINDNQGDYSRTVKEGMEPALAKLGLSIAKKVVISNPQTQSSNAELQMATSGVTHVLFAAPGGAAVSQFMIAADSQGRTYRYGVSSQDAPGLTVQVLAPHRQLLNAAGYGYKPSLDVDGSNQPPQTAGMKACLSHYTSKGYDTGSLNRAAMTIICDSVELVRAALEGQAAPSQASMAEAVARLGTSLPAAGTFATSFSERQHDGAGAYRFLRYDGERRAFRYVGDLRRAS